MAYTVPEVMDVIENKITGKKNLLSFFFIAAIAGGCLMQLESFVKAVLVIYENISGSRLSFPFRQAGFAVTGQIMALSGLFLLAENNIQRPHHRRLLILSVYAALLLFFYLKIFCDAVNVPVWDDYGTMLEFANKWTGTATLYEKWKLIVSPFYESRMIMLRSFCAFFLILLHEINFRHVIFITDLLLLGITWLFIKTMPRDNNFIYRFLPIAIIIFQLQSYDCLLWATAGFNFIFTFFFAFCAIYYSVNGRAKSPWLFLFFATTAACTYGNGWILFPMVAAVYFSRKDYRNGVIIFVYMALTSLLYFNGAHEGPSNPATEIAWIVYPAYYFAFCGSAFRYFNSEVIAIAAGLTMNIYFFVFLFRKQTVFSDILSLLILFILLSAGMTTILRAADGGLGQALSPRYGFYSQMLFVSLLMKKMQAVNNKEKFVKLLLPISLALQLLTGFMFYPEAVVRKRTLLEYIQPWKEGNLNHVVQSNAANPWRFGPDPEAVITNSIKAGNYKP
jgi:hypothetical protein